MSFLYLVCKLLHWQGTTFSVNFTLLLIKYALYFFRIVSVIKYIHLMSFFLQSSAYFSILSNSKRNVYFYITVYILLYLQIIIFLCIFVFVKYKRYSFNCSTISINTELLPINSLWNF